jgi:tRNA threonylcarbamoyladenosine biosynthesis protein TsaB
MPTILAIDTSTNLCTVALMYNNKDYIISEDTPSRHAEVILSFIDTVLANAGVDKTDLEIIAPTIGPGSFIGVRTGVAVAQTIAFSLDCLVAPLPTLQVLAQSAYLDCGCKEIIVLLDARMQAIYYGKYTLNHENIMQAQQDALVLATANIPKITKNDYCVGGNALNNYPTIDTTLAKVILPNLQPEGQAMLQLANYLSEKNNLCNPQDVIPQYVRNDVAHKASHD